MLTQTIHKATYTAAYTLRNFVAITTLLVCWVLLLGMGGTTGEDFPTPDMDFHATVTDERGITTSCTGVSWEGEVFFKAKRGEATVTIPFEKVRSIKRIARNGDGTVDFRISLKDGKDVAVTFNEESRFFGKTNFGTYKITAKNIQRAVFD
jgi:hypothetical protein